MNDENNFQNSIEFNNRLRKRKLKNNKSSYYVTIPPADAEILTDKLEVKVGHIVNVKIRVKKY